MSNRPRVLLTDRAWPDTSYEQVILDRIGAELVESPSADEATLCRIAADCDAIATNWAKVTPAVIAAGLEAAGIDGRRRAETLTVEEWEQLVEALE